MEPATVSDAIKNEVEEAEAGRKIQLPKQLEAVTPAAEFPTEIHRWYTNEEVASILIAFDKHKEWLHKQKEPKIRPPSGSMLLYNRKEVRYRQDGYCWKKRKDGKTMREDHMKLKVQGVECIYGCYVHSAILPTFHRRCYWLLQNHDIVLLHYLNVPLSDDNKIHIPTLSLCGADKKQWTEEDLQSQVRPMYASMRHTDPSRFTDEMLEKSIDSIVGRLLATQQKPISRTCSCPGSTCTDTSRCRQRVISPRRSLPPNAPSRGNRLVSLLNSAAIDTSIRTSPAVVAPSEQQGVAQQQPLILNLSQLQGSNGLVILSSQAATPIMVNSAPQVQPQPQLQTPAGQDQGQGHGQIQGHEQGQALKQTVFPNAQTQGQPLHAQGQVLTPNVGQGQGQVQAQSKCQGPNQLSMATDVKGASNENHFDLFNIINNPETQNGTNQMYSEFCPDTSDQGMDVSQGSYDGNQVKNTTMTISPGDQNVALATTSGMVHHDSNNLTTAGVSAVEELVSTAGDFQNFDPAVQLTHDDIRETLATLPAPTSQSVPHQDNLQSNGIDDALQNLMVSPQSADLNFDAFDILDLADLDTDNLTSDTGSIAHTSSLRLASLTTTVTTAMASTAMPSTMSCVSCANHAGVHSVRENRAGIANITDFSPEWAYPEGGSKVLVTGPWYCTTSPYTVQFDGVTVQATLVQSGVLRCYTPAHVPSVVTLQVSCEGFVISNTRYFEFKCRESSQSDMKCEQSTSDTYKQHSNWFDLCEDQLKMALLGRFREIEKRLVPAGPDCKPTSKSGSRSSCNDVFEDRLMEHVECFIQRKWQPGCDLLPPGDMRLTLLHLVAGLGYSGLINSLIKWRSENPSIILEYEVDALSLDGQNCCPLAWACAHGKASAALVLYHWNSAALSVRNKDGHLPLTVSRKYGHLDIVHGIEDLELARLNPVHTIPSEHSLPDLSQVALSKVTFMPPPPPLPLRVQVKSNSAPAATAADRQPFDSPNWSTPLTSLTIQIPPSPPFTNTTTRRHDSLPSLLHSTPLRTTPSPNAGENATMRRLRLMKRTSVEVLPDYPVAPFESDVGTKCSKTDTMTDSTEALRPATSDPHLVGLSRPQLADPMISVSDRDLNSPLGFMNPDPTTSDAIFDLEHVAMETDSSGASSPLLGVDSDSGPISQLAGEGDGTTPPQMMALANQIIAAMPERIKLSPSRSDDLLTEEISSRRDRSSSYGSFSSCSSTATPPCVARDSGISTPLEGMAFEDYRYPDLGTPASSLSPASSCLHSPYNFSFDSFPPTTAEFTEYFNAPNFYMEKDFSQLTLSDEEQRRLYEAAKIIQNFYRKYKDQKELQQKQRQKEIEAAILIQSYYRRYKQYMYYKKMSQAAILIQSQFRTYYAQKRFKMSREAATIIQNRYRAYKQQERYKKSRSAAVLIQQRFRSHYQRKRSQQDMARKVQEMVDEPSLSSDPSDTLASAALTHSSTTDDAHDAMAPPGDSQRTYSGSDMAAMETKDAGSPSSGGANEHTAGDSPSTFKDI